MAVGKQVTMISVSDWDKLIKETYGKEYSFQQQDGCKGRGVFSFNVPVTHTDDYMRNEIPIEVNGDIMGVSFETWKNTPPDAFDNLFEQSYQIILIWERNFYPDVSMIIDDLAKRGLLEKGEYVIDIDW